MNKYKWATKEIIFETKDTVTIVFDTLASSFGYKSGQFVNITQQIEGQQVTRSYSLSSSPSDNYPSITVKKVDNGVMSHFLFDHAAQVKEWHVEGPFGNFSLDAAIEKAAPVVFLGGGSGITPLFAILKEVLSSGDHAPLLLYSNQDPENVIFKTELARMELANQLTSYYAFSRAEKSSDHKNHLWGRFNSLTIKSIIKRHCENIADAHFYICGPNELKDLYRNIVLGMGAQDGQVYVEEFQLDASESLAAAELPDTSFDVMVNYFDTMTINDVVESCGNTTLVSVEPRQSLLDAMQANHLRVAHSCKNGTCGSCWARHVSGHVKMVNNQALTKEQVLEEKLILLCQSYAMNDEVTIDLVEA